MIDRFEILKDGGSSIYGSDAVAGASTSSRAKATKGFRSPLTATTRSTAAAIPTSSTEFGAPCSIAGPSWSQPSTTSRDPLTIGDRDFFSCAQDNVYEVSTGRLLDIIDPATGESQCFNTLEGVGARFCAAASSCRMPRLCPTAGLMGSI